MRTIAKKLDSKDELKKTFQNTQTVLTLLFTAQILFTQKNHLNAVKVPLKYHYKIFLY